MCANMHIFKYSK